MDVYSAQDGRRTCDAGGVILSRMAGTVGYYSAMHLGFTQLMLLPAAIAAESSIQAKRPMSENDKTSLQASLRQVFAILSRMAG